MEIVFKELETMPASLQDINLFLTVFKQQSRKHGLIYYNWQDNLQALFDLEITARRREKVILNLKDSDYLIGPHPDELKGGVTYWVFETEIKGKVVHIELSLADHTGSACCYAFKPK